MIKITVEGIPGLQAELKGKVNPEKIDKTLEQGVILMEAEAKKRCPVDTRNLMESINHRKIGNLTYEIKASAIYADFIEYGTMAHWIYPKNKQALHWVKDGVNYFSKGVYHPGIKVGTEDNPLVYSSAHKAASYRPFLRSAVYDKFDTVVKMIEQSLNKE